MTTEPLVFGTDGVRGRAGTGVLRPACLERLGRALGDHLHRQDPGAGEVWIGGDTRASRQEISGALAQGLAHRGFRVVDVGVLPTAAVALVARQGNAAAAIVVSASHNPAEDNGVKVFVGPEGKLSDQDARWIEGRWAALEQESPAPAGTPPETRDAREEYLQILTRAVPAFRLDGWKVVLDLAHGAAFEVGPELVRRLGAEVVCLGDRPDGLNINRGCGSQHPQSLQAAVCEHGADLGFAMDGDADRCLFVDGAGRVVDGDAILVLAGTDLAERQRLVGDTVVGTVMSNYGLESCLRSRGLRLERTPVGDRHVTGRLREGGFCLGGEPSGHVIFGADLHYLGDGLFTALRVLEVLVRRAVPLASVWEVYHPTPQVHRTLRVARRPPLDRISGFREKLSQAERTLAGRGRTVVRYSGTEPVLRIMVEGPDRSEAEALADALARTAAAQLGEPGSTG